MLPWVRECRSDLVSSTPSLPYVFMLLFLYPIRCSPEFLNIILSFFEGFLGEKGLIIF